MAEAGVFLKQLIKRPHQIGAIAPSSLALARDMAGAVPEGAGNVIEIGAGTGRITAALLASGVAPASIHVFDINRSFCDHLSRIFPGVSVRCDRAENIGGYDIGDIKAVVSGLPLLSMDANTQRGILGAAFDALRPDGVFIQFTYGFRPPVRKAICNELGLGWSCTRTVWKNLPPARCYCFRRAA